MVEGGFYEKNHCKILSSFLLALTPHQLSASSSTIQTNSNKYNQRLSLIANNYEPTIELKIIENGVVITKSIGRPRAIGSILIFLGGIVVGQIVDGVVLNITGQTSAEWVSTAIDWINEPRFPLNKTYSITISADQSSVSTFETSDGNICHFYGNQYSCLYELLS